MKSESPLIWLLIIGIIIAGWKMSGPDLPFKVFLVAPSARIEAGSPSSVGLNSAKGFIWSPGECRPSASPSGLSSLQVVEVEPLARPR